MVSRVLWNILWIAFSAPILAENMVSRLDSAFDDQSAGARRLQTVTEVWVDGDATLSEVGTEEVANTYTVGDQDYPDIAPLEGGGYVIVWVSYNQDAGVNDDGIYGQMFFENGTMNGEEFEVNTYTSNAQITPVVAGLVGGGFAVAWASTGNDASGYGILAQIYDETGDRIATEIPVNTYYSSNQQDPDIVGLVDGGFLVAWTNQGSQDGSSYGIFAQKFDGIGTRIGEEFQVNTYTSSVQRYPSMCRLNSGNIIITWETYGQDQSSTYGIAAREFNETGSPVDDEFIVNTYGANNQYNPEVSALSGGGYIIVYYGISGNSDTTEIYGQRFNADGKLVGSEFLVNEYGSGTPYYPQATGLAGGYFMVTYEVSGNQDGDDYGIYAQVYNKAGTRLGEEITVNWYNAYDQRNPRITTLESGRIVVTWWSDVQDTNGNGVIYKMYDFSALSEPPTENPTTSPTKAPTKSPEEPTCVQVWDMIVAYTGECNLICSELSGPAAHAAVLPMDGTTPQDDVNVDPEHGGDLDDSLKTTGWLDWLSLGAYKEEIVLLLIAMNAVLMCALCNMRRQSTKKYEAVEMYSSEAENLQE